MCRNSSFFSLMLLIICFSGTLCVGLKWQGLFRGFVFCSRWQILQVVFRSKRFRSTIFQSLYTLVYHKTFTINYLFKVKKIHTSIRYTGITSSYAYDIAVLELKVKLTLTDVVQPVCVDWTNIYENEQLQANSFGIVSNALSSIEVFNR